MKNVYFNNYLHVDLIDDLALKAKRIKTNLDELKEPLIIEFAGTPHSGKTTAIEALSTFFKRNKIQTEKIIEQAQFCTLNNNRFYFNIWTGCKTLTNLINIIEKKIPEIVLIDRGIFDTLVWLNYFFFLGNISEDSLRKAESFFLVDDWIKSLDIIVILRVDAKDAIKRDYQSQITNIAGNIMNENSLLKYNNILNMCISKYRSKIFATFISLDTTGIDPISGVKLITDKVVYTADKLKDAEIAFISRNDASDILEVASININHEGIKSIIPFIQNKYQWKKRSLVEERLDLVQFVPVIVFTFKDMILTFEIKGIAQGQILVNKFSIWVGGHTRKEDILSDGMDTSILNVFQKTLLREIREEIYFEMKIQDLSKFPRAIIWDDSNKRSIQHLGIFYEYEIKTIKDFDYLNRREFTELNDKSLRTEFIKLDDIISLSSKLEPWSKKYLRNLYNIDFYEEDYQRHIF